MKVLNRPASAAARIFAATVSRRADENEIVLEQVFGVEQVLHDLGSAGLAAADEHFGVFGDALLESLAGLRQRQKALIGAARAE